VRGGGRATAARFACLVVALVLAGCGTDYEGTEDRAADRAREWARSTQEALADAVAANGEVEGQALLDLVGETVQDRQRHVTTFGLALESADEAILGVAFDGRAESGGGGTYYQFLARLCVEYRVRPSADEPVTAADTRCPQELLEPTGPTQKADRTISLAD
jgi:hypothetical protein